MRDYVAGGRSTGTGTAVNRAPRHETLSTLSLRISESLHPNMRT